MSIYLGIDFGTSTNYVTRWNETDGTVKAVPNLDPTIYTGDEVFPNVIFYSQNGEKLVGQAAVKRSSIEPRNGVVGVKRKLLEDNWLYNIPALGGSYSPVDVSTDIFAYIKEKVSTNNGGADIDGVVISVPYAYGNKERQKIKRAAERAGLNVLDLIEEPVAAAISYGVFQKTSKMGHSEKIMVFDFGGGTLDITVFGYQKTPDGKVTIEVLNTDGLRNFGGQVIDDILLRKLSNKAGLSVSEISDQEQRIKFQAELTDKVIEMKEESQYWDEDDEEEFEQNISGIQIDTSVTLEDLENWLRGERVMEKIRTSIDDALIDCGEKGLEPEDIDRVLLVGGSSNFPFVRRLLTEIFGKEPEECDNIEINKMVGYGAGVYCGMKAENRDDIKIVQKLSYSVGVKTGTKFNKMIAKNEKYGTYSKAKKFALADSKENRDIEVYQGNSNDITKCFLIGKIPVSHLEVGSDKEIEITLGTTEAGMVAYKVFCNGNCYEGMLE